MNIARISIFTASLVFMGCSSNDPTTNPAGENNYTIGPISSASCLPSPDFRIGSQATYALKRSDNSETQYTVEVVEITNTVVSIDISSEGSRYTYRRSIGCNDVQTDANMGLQLDQDYIGSLIAKAPLGYTPEESLFGTTATTIYSKSPCSRHTGSENIPALLNSAVVRCTYTAEHDGTEINYYSEGFDHYDDVDTNDATAVSPIAGLYYLEWKYSSGDLISKIYLVDWNEI